MVYVQCSGPTFSSRALREDGETRRPSLSLGCIDRRSCTDRAGMCTAGGYGETPPTNADESQKSLRIKRHSTRPDESCNFSQKTNDVGPLGIAANVQT
jgi:hypothetical protein